MKILIVLGTRPEAIKMAPLILALSNDLFFNISVCVTAQHREMLDQVLNIFNIIPNYDLNIMHNNYGLNEVTSNILNRIQLVLEDYGPDIVLVHGDTTTTLASSLAAFYKRIPIGHIEAGLRSGSLYSPWPEEANRKLTGHLANWHFAPTINARNNLLAEGVPETHIIVTGNTVIDALLWVQNCISNNIELLSSLEEHYFFLKKTEKIILVTSHRRENFGEGIKQICNALQYIALDNPDVLIVYSVHLNPNVNNLVYQYFSNSNNIKLIKPQNYLRFIYLMNRATIILTDSGGIQEEAPTLGKPVLLMRNITERPEAVIAGTVKLVGTNTKIIYDTVSELLTDKKTYERMSKLYNPYGDGHACERIIMKLKNIG